MRMPFFLAISLNALSSCCWQSHLFEWKTSPVRHSECTLNNGKMVQPPVFIDMDRKLAILCRQLCRFLFFNSGNHLEKEKNMPYLNLSSVFVFLFLFFVALFLFFLSLVIPLHESRFFRAHLLAVHKLFAPFLVVYRV